MSDFQIRCINRNISRNPHERVISIGGVNRGRRWRLTQQEVIHVIEIVGNRFWVGSAGNRAWVIVAMHRGNKYIKTENDESHPNNLLSLPECPE